jgi:hypothetical protein
VPPATEDWAAYIAGFVAAEGTFVRCGTPPTFTFAVALGATDADTCEMMHEYFGVGAVRAYPRRKAHYDDEVCFSVRALRDLVGVIVPFMDEHLPPSYKREQYEVWRAALLDYWQHGMRRRRPCTISGCDRPQRAKGLCRHGTTTSRSTAGDVSRPTRGSARM